MPKLERIGEAVWKCIRKIFTHFWSKFVLLLKKCLRRDEALGESEPVMLAPCDLDIKSAVTVSFFCFV